MSHPGNPEARPVREVYLQHVDKCSECRGFMLCEVGERYKLAEQLEAIGWERVAREVVK